MVYKPTYNWGAPSCRSVPKCRKGKNGHFFNTDVDLSPKIGPCAVLGRTGHLLLQWVWMGLVPPKFGENHQSDNHAISTKTDGSGKTGEAANQII